MQLLKPSVEIIPQLEGLKGIYTQIELAGRTCYKSEDKITETSAKKFVDRMIRSKHGAMLEHGTVYLYLNYPGLSNIINRYKNNKYSKVLWGSSIMNAQDIDCWYITTNLRVLVENDWLEDLKYLCEPTEYHEKRVTANFNAISIGIAREFTRHRVFSFAQQSTRYCNYSKKSKFNSGLIFIIPEKNKDKLKEGSYTRDRFECTHINDVFVDIGSTAEVFLNTLYAAEENYLKCINSYNYKPQEAREVLPLALNAPLVMTGFISDWNHFLELRCAESAHPDARVLANSLKEKFVNLT